MIFSKSEHKFALTISKLAHANPFLPERVELEREALGKDFDKSTRPYWSWTLDDELDRPNVIALTERVIELTAKVREKISECNKVSKEDFELYDDLALYVLYYQQIVRCEGDPKTGEIRAQDWDDFRNAFEHWMNVDGKKSASFKQPEHVFAFLHQIRRAFHNIFLCVIGRSWPIAKLRARIFESIFTHDMRRCRNGLFASMNEVTTLVVGPTGTGKELVARAVGLSQYSPFNSKTKKFMGLGKERFVALNLTAFTPTLIESELFGHEKGAFTGATSARQGWLESCSQYGTVFLDEIGELDLAIQVKLLRVIQNRQFQRTGETKTRRFDGKFIAATNRNLAEEIESGNFREDFYYRLCSDVIETPSLVEQLEDSADEFEFLTDFICHRIAPAEAAGLKKDVLDWRQRSGRNHHWPGNMRELEQCVRNVMIHNDYQPSLQQNHTGRDSFETLITDVSLTADGLLARYCQLAYQKHGTYEKAAAVIGLDRRTVRAKCAQLEKDL
jgi:transcriptional regulator with AAA-type ATPase domain